MWTKRTSRAAQKTQSPSGLDAPRSESFQSKQDGDGFEVREWSGNSFRSWRPNAGPNCGEVLFGCVRNSQQGAIFPNTILFK